MKPSTTLVREHAEGCPDCAAAPLPGESLAAVLARLGAEQSRRAPVEVVAALAPGLAVLRSRATSKRMAAAVGLALLPLPLLASYGLWFVARLGEIASWLLPSPVATFVALSYAATLVLLYALTYAAVPLLVERAASRRMLPREVAA